jgi:hypothetical protein
MVTAAADGAAAASAATLLTWADPNMHRIKQSDIAGACTGCTRFKRVVY